jgi:hypothetical protein
MQFLGVSIDKEPLHWTKYLDKKKPAWPQYILSDYGIVDQLTIEYIPHKILLNFADSTFKLNVELHSISEQ